MRRGLGRAVLRPLAAAGVLLGLSAGCGEPQQTDGELRAAVDSLLPRLASLSGLEQRGPVAFARRSRAELRAFVERQIAEELPPGELEGIEAAYQVFGLLPDSLDLHALLLELYTEQVVGYYDPARDTLYLVEDVSAADLGDVLAHELVHALQDQHADLEALVGRERGNDRQTAAQAAIEGHATLVMFGLQAARIAGGEVDFSQLPNLAAQLRPALEGQNERFPVFRDAPRIVRETLLFPYLGGAGFVQELWRAAAPERPAPLGEHLPLPTEQVLHPRARFLQERDAPTEVVLGPQPLGGRSAEAAREGEAHEGGGWRVVHENTLGELEMRILLEEMLGAGAAGAAAGWDGDRFRVLEGPGGERALVWYSVWDEAARADGFAALFREGVERRDGWSALVERVEHQGRSVVRVRLAAGRAASDVPDPGLSALTEEER